MVMYNFQNQLLEDLSIPIIKYSTQQHELILYRYFSMKPLFESGQVELETLNVINFVI